MFRITRDRSSGNSIERTAKITSLDCAKITTLDCAVPTRTTGKYAAITSTTSISTDTIEPLL